MVLMSEHNPPSAAESQPHSVRCEQHGLRYDPKIHNGCVRCRRERGELPTASPGAARGAAAQAGSLGAAVGVAVALIFSTGMVLYLDDLRAWKKVQEMRESGRYLEGLTPEQQEQVEEFRRRMEKLVGDQDEDEED